METISQRLIHLLDKKGITIYNLSERTGIAQSTLGRIKNKNAKPNKENRKTIADFFGVTVEWLIYGEEKNDVAANNLIGDDFRTIEHNGVKYIELPEGKKVAMLPYVDVNMYSYFANNPDSVSKLPYYPYHTVDFLFTKLMAFRMNDDSMESNNCHTIKRGAVLVANEVNEKTWRMEALYNGSHCFVVISKGLLLIRSLSYNDGDDYVTLHAKNELYSDSKVLIKDIDRLYKVQLKQTRY